MSEVYAAEDTVLGRQVAVKMLRPEMARDVNFRERFYREAQNSGKLNHPNIVAVYDTGETELDGMTIPYIVMERVNGRTLRDIIREDGALSAQEAADILKPVADALQASHEAGIIHRDIKPANIMLTNTGQVKAMPNQTPPRPRYVASSQMFCCAAAMSMCEKRGTVKPSVR